MITVLLTLLPLAFADAATGPETCLMERYDDEHCISCDANYEASDACESEWSAQGYEHACSTQGGSYWSEIWCEPGYAEPIDGDSGDSGAADKDGCGCATGAGGGLLAFAGALGLVLSRRK